MLPGQKPQDRPDIVSRVFRLKLKAIVSDIKDRHIFGEGLAQLFVIKFHKRGLPHAHMLIILRDGFKPATANDYDKIVCEEIPDPTRHPNLYATVTRRIMHGLCAHVKRNAACMKNNVCSKNTRRIGQVTRTQTEMATQLTDKKITEELPREKTQSTKTIAGLLRTIHTWAPSMIDTSTWRFVRLFRR